MTLADWGRAFILLLHFFPLKRNSRPSFSDFGTGKRWGKQRSLTYTLAPVCLSVVVRWSRWPLVPSFWTFNSTSAFSVTSTLQREPPLSLEPHPLSIPPGPAMVSLGLRVLGSCLVPALSIIYYVSFYGVIQTAVSCGEWIGWNMKVSSSSSQAHWLQSLLTLLRGLLPYAFALKRSLNPFVALPLCLTLGWSHFCCSRHLGCTHNRVQVMWFWMDGIPHSPTNDYSPWTHPGWSLSIHILA